MKDPNRRTLRQRCLEIYHWKPLDGLALATAGFQIAMFIVAFGCSGCLEIFRAKMSFAEVFLMVSGVVTVVVVLYAGREVGLLIRAQQAEERKKWVDRRSVVRLDVHDGGKETK